MNITWKINNLERMSNDGFVFRAYWECAITDVDDFGKAISSSIIGSVDLTRIEEFIPFENLTKEIVLGWVKPLANYLDVESSLISDIELKKTPQKLFGVPWSLE